MNSLTNHLQAVATLSGTDINQIVAQHFGEKTSAPSGSTVFDMDSAVFESISRTNVVYQGRPYYGYRIKLVDQNGNYQTNIDCFAEPNPDYERSLATMEMINRSPQLKRIYQAMASSLAERSTQSQSTSSDSSQPAFRLIPGIDPVKP